MFDNLIESQPKRERTIGELVVSFVVHGVLIAGAAVATKGAAETVRAIVEDTTSFLLKPPPPPPPPPDQPPPPDVVVSANPPPQGFQTIVPPKNIPTNIPPVNLTEKFDSKNYSGKGVEGGIATGVVGGVGPVVTGEVFTVNQIDDPAQYLSGPDPRYPPGLKAASIEGVVTLEFIVSAEGRVEGGSIKVISSTNKAFEEPAVETVRKSIYKPARVAGSAVRQLVRQAVRFTIT
ncbi:MAG: energy transducer TonB [Gemmatimonadales bacterium]|nr:energy transducer TonB [Gemmatimonadales bacterium]